MDKTADHGFQLLTVGQMAELLQVKTSWLYRRTSERSIPCLRVGRYIRFRPERVLAWLESEYGQTAQEWMPGGYGPFDGPQGGDE